MLSGQVGLVSLLEPRGSLLRRQTGRGLTGAWLMKAMVVDVGERR
jgi:hypothetical protein